MNLKASKMGEKKETYESESLHCMFIVAFGLTKKSVVRDF